MKTAHIGNARKYTECTHYLKSSPKWIKSMRIAKYILDKVFPNHTLSHCEAMFPNYNSKFITINKFGVNIVCEVSSLHTNRVYFSFFTH